MKNYKLTEEHIKQKLWLKNKYVVLNMEIWEEEAGEELEVGRDAGKLYTNKNENRLFNFHINLLLPSNISFFQSNLFSKQFNYGKNTNYLYSVKNVAKQVANFCYDNNFIVEYCRLLYGDRPEELPILTIKIKNTTQADYLEQLGYPLNIAEKLASLV